MAVCSSCEESIPFPTDEGFCVGCNLSHQESAYLDSVLDLHWTESEEIDRLNFEAAWEEETSNGSL